MSGKEGANVRFLRRFLLLAALLFPAGTILYENAALGAEKNLLSEVPDANVPGGQLPDEAAAFPPAPGSASSLSIDGRGALAFPEPADNTQLTEKDKELLRKLIEQEGV